MVKKRLTDLSSKIKTAIQPVFISRKINEDLKVPEDKPAIVNQQCLVYKFQCNLCDAGYVGYTRGHLHERVDGHKQKSSSICKHYFSEHSSNVPGPCTVRPIFFFHNRQRSHFFIFPFLPKKLEKWKNKLRQRGYPIILIFYFFVENRKIRKCPNKLFG